MLSARTESPLDPTDLAILAALRRDGRMTVERLSQEVHLSRPAAHERVRRLEARGIIRGYTALIDWGAVGLPMVAFVQVRGGRHGAGTAEAIGAMSTPSAMVEEVHHITGEWCFLVKARVASPAALEQLLDRIKDVESVSATMTTLALSTADVAAGLPSRIAAVP